MKIEHMVKKDGVTKVMSTWNGTLDSMNPKTAYQVNTTVVQSCCQETVSNDPYVPIRPRNVTLWIEAWDGGEYKTRIRNHAKVSLGSIVKTCKGTSMKWPGHGPGICESVGYDTSWGCWTQRVDTDGTPTLLVFGNFTNRIQTSKPGELYPETNPFVITNSQDIFRITVEKVEKNFSAKINLIHPILLLMLAFTHMVM